MSRLKTLYKHLIEDQESKLKLWGDNYREFHKEVEDVRERIKNGKVLSAKEDKDFLDELIYKQGNKITSRGQSIIGKEDFRKLIGQTVFMSALQEFIKEPNKANFENFGKAWEEHAPRNNPVIVNRVAAACTLKVSTTVDKDKFNEVFKWLIDEGLIPNKYPEEKPQDWFSKNTWLLGEIEKELKLKGVITDEYSRSQFVWQLYEYMNNPFSLKKQVVKYGPPGTGKTYQARQQTSQLFDIWKDEFAKESPFTHEAQIELVQFHPSFSYEDFMEGLRPVLAEDGTAQLKLQNGVFKEFCRKAGKWEIDVHNLKLDKDWESITIKDLLPRKEELQQSPGDHWKYIFKLPESALVSDAVPPFFFIIDEINRAELSRVFGELMYCLEYRGIKGAVKTQYANLNNEDTGMIEINEGYQFFIPTNIYLIGTMNTIDRSVESFDFALRRRFRWEEVMPDTGVLKHHLKKEWQVLADNLEKLNEKIKGEPLLGSDYQIGHAYLMNLKYDTNLDVKAVREHIWDDSIRPLLQEYLRGTGKEADSFAQEFEIQ